MSAPSTELFRYALVRPPRRDEARLAASQSLFVALSEEAAEIAAQGNQDAKALLRNRLMEHIKASRTRIDVGAKLLSILRTADNATFADNNDLAALKTEFGAAAGNEAAIANLGDLYIFAMLDRDHEAAALIGEDIRALRALDRLAESTGTTILDLANPPLVVDLRTMSDLEPAAAEQYPTERKNARDAHSAMRIKEAQEAVYLAVARDNLDEIVAHGHYKIVAATGTEVAPPTNADPSLPARLTREANAMQLLPSVDLAAALGTHVADFLASELGIEDPNGVDMPTLRAAVSASLESRLARLFAGVAPRVLVRMSRQLAEHVSLFRAGNIEQATRGLDAFALGTTASPGSRKIRPKGIADLKVVRQQLQRYALGEIAHIENVLRGETRGRKHHRGEKIEQMFNYEEEQTSTTEKDLQTTERFDLSQETQLILDEKRKTEAGLNVSASYGVVTVSADASLASEQSIQNSAKVARNYARETISKASERLEKRTKRQTTITTTVETTEDNEHSFAAPDESISGVYRWVEKSYWCQTFNYGARLMFEVAIPEPAAFYLYAISMGADAGTELRPPPALAFEPGDLNVSTYHQLAAPYGTTVTAPPPAYAYSAIATLQGKETESGAKAEFDIPEGYEMLAISPIAATRIIANGRASYTVLVSPHLWHSEIDGWTSGTFWPPVRGKFELGFNGVYVEHYAVSAGLLLKRQDEAFAKWQLSTFNAIQESYQQQKSDYERKLATLQARRQTVSARTDQEYRDIEKSELKRAGIELITGQDFSQFNAMQFPSNAPPYLDWQQAAAEGEFVRFIEESLEWSEMVYSFYPYFWGSKTRWTNAYSEGNDDPVFKRFLRAGFGKVVIPVRPTTERRLIYFIETGTIWTGDDIPLPNDPTLLSMVKEVEQLNAEHRLQGVPEGSPWQLVVPTNLVCLETDSLKLPSWEITVPAGDTGYLPSIQTCNGRPYNAAQWSDDRAAVVESLSTLGFKVPSKPDAIRYLSSKDGIRVVRAFQTHANYVGVAQALGEPLLEDGLMGPCTLRALTVATAMNLAGGWCKPT